MTQRLSVQAKRLSGTDRDDRRPKRTALERLRAVPPAPEHLSVRAQVEWGPLATACVELGTLTSADLRGLELLAEVLATEAELRELLKTEGMTIPGADGNSKSHPACKLLESTRNQAARLLSDFGLTPKGRQSVDVYPAPSVNPFSNNGKPVGLAKYLDRKRP
ncbi:MAG: phage terminase small subunit P27 family [Acidobacteriota bacterium]